MTQAFGLVFPTDFLEPWKLSDVVLVVEDQKFHVHRSILAFWSPVFEKMFTTEFKEKNNDEIPLPGKKESEIKHLLLMLYPSLEEKQVTKSNCYFLFELAHEYQIESIARKCEALMVTMVKQRVENDVLAMLIYGQKYLLKTLISTCIYEARRLKLMELKQHKRRDEVEPDNYLKIAEGIIERLETKCKEVRQGSLKSLERVSESLYLHVKVKNNEPIPSSGKRSYMYEKRSEYSDYGRYDKCVKVPPAPITTGERLDYLLNDDDKSSGNVKCMNLKSIAEELIAHKKTIETLP